MRQLLRVGSFLLLGFLACDNPEGPVQPDTGGLALRILRAGGGVPFDSGYVILQGPTNATIKVRPGQDTTVSNLKPGSYTVGLEGFAHDATGSFVSSFQQLSVTIVAGQT